MVARLRTEGWAISPTFELLDAGVRVATDVAGLLPLLEALFGHTVGERADADLEFMVGHALGPDGPGYFVARDGVVLVRTPGPTVAFAHLVFEANQQAIIRSSGQLRLHASAVARGADTIVCAGAMGAGKSTLAAGLMRRGFEYVTDEVVAIGGAGTVRRYAKPLSLGVPPAALGPIEWVPPENSAGFLGASGLVPPEAVGSVSRGAELHPALIVLPRYRRGAPTRVREFVGVDAVEAVAAHAFHLDEPGVMARLVEFLRDVPCLEIESGDLDEACDAVIAAAGIRSL